MMASRFTPKILPAAPTDEKRAPLVPSETRCDLLFKLVGDTGIEPVTSSVSRKRAPAAPIALVQLPRWRRDLNPCTRLCRPLPRLSATPPS
jgi:hypothetical protein